MNSRTLLIYNSDVACVASTFGHHLTLVLVISGAYCLKLYFLWAVRVFCPWDHGVYVVLFYGERILCLMSVLLLSPCRWNRYINTWIFHILQHMDCSGSTGIGWYSNNNTLFSRIGGTCKLYKSLRQHPVHGLFRVWRVLFKAERTVCMMCDVCGGSNLKWH